MKHVRWWERKQKVLRYNESWKELIQRWSIVQLYVHKQCSFVTYSRWNYTHQSSLTHFPVSCRAFMAKQTEMIEIRAYKVSEKISLSWLFTAWKYFCRNVGDPLCSWQKKYKKHGKAEIDTRFHEFITKTFRKHRIDLSEM